MPVELDQWVSPAILIAILLYIHRSLRQDMRDLRGEVKDLRREVRELRQHVDTQNSDLRDRLGRIEGYLDLLQQFFIGGGRGTAA